MKKPDVPPCINCGREPEHMGGNIVMCANKDCEHFGARAGIGTWLERKPVPLSQRRRK